MTDLPPVRLQIKAAIYPERTTIIASRGINRHFTYEDHRWLLDPEGGEGALFWRVTQALDEVGATWEDV